MELVSLLLKNLIALNFYGEKVKISIKPYMRKFSTWGENRCSTLLAKQQTSRQLFGFPICPRITMYRDLHVLDQIYFGTPDKLVHDTGNNKFSSSALKGITDMHCIQTNSVPVESGDSMIVAKRYHTPLRRTLSIIRAEVADLSKKKQILQMAVKSIKNSVGPHGLVPTLLVLEASPVSAIRVIHQLRQRSIMYFPFGKILQACRNTFRRGRWALPSSLEMARM